MREVSVFLCFLLLLAPMRAWGQESGMKTRTEIRQIPPNPAETTGIYIPGVKPFLWQNHGGMPYFPAPERSYLIRLSQKESLVEDLIGQSLSPEQANFVKRALENAETAHDQIGEVILPVDTSIRNMRFGAGRLVPMVIVKGSPVPAWQIILPPELGSLIVWFPKICGNPCLSVTRAELERLTLETEIREREKIVEVEKEVVRQEQIPLYVDRSVHRTTKKTVNIYHIENGGCGKGCKLLIFGALVGAAITTGVVLSNKDETPSPTPDNSPYKPPGGGGGVD